jgi:hypothetical protein
MAMPAGLITFSTHIDLQRDERAPLHLQMPVNKFCLKSIHQRQ